MMPEGLAQSGRRPGVLTSSGSAGPAAQKTPIRNRPVDRSSDRSPALRNPSRREAAGGPARRTGATGAGTQDPAAQDVGHGKHRAGLPASGEAPRALPERAHRLRHPARERADHAALSGGRAPDHDRPRPRHPSLPARHAPRHLVDPARRLRPAAGSRVLYPVLGDLLVPRGTHLVPRLQRQGKLARQTARRRGPLQRIQSRGAELPDPAPGGLHEPRRRGGAGARPGASHASSPGWFVGSLSGAAVAAAGMAGGRVPSSS